MRGLAEHLTKAGVNVVLDEWHLKLGDQLPRFMEEAIATADYVLLICTETYVKKADARAGGVGYESSLVSAQLLTPAQIEAKGVSRIIPIVRQAADTHLLPRFAAGRYYVNLSDSSPDPSGEFEKLVRALHGTPKHQPPPRGTNPFGPTSTEHEPSGQPGSGKEAATATSSRAIVRAIATARRSAAAALAARLSKFPQLEHSTAEGRVDELTAILRTHEEYLREIVRATLRGEVSVRHIAQEIEELALVPGWPQSGVLRLVKLPRVLGWAAHRLAGAALLLEGRAASAVDLAGQSVMWDNATRAIIKVPELTGWPVIPGNSRETWNATREWPSKFSWITELFGGSEEYWNATVAHAITLNLAEFLDRVRHGPSFAEVRQDREHGPHSPLYFWGESPLIQRRAMRLVKEDGDELQLRLEPAIHLNLTDLWALWLEFQRKWLATERENGSLSSPPHESLLSELLPHHLRR